MDLKIKDVAELLNVSETTIRRWLLEGKIPAYRIQHQYRFSRIEIENWVLSCRLSQTDDELKAHQNKASSNNTEETPSLPSNQQFSLYRAIYRGEVLKGITSTSKEGIIREVVETCVANLLPIDTEILIELLLDRENLMSTALSHGIALPHTREFLLKGPFDIAVIVFPQEPVDWGALDGEFINTLFFLFASDDKRHLHLLAKIAHFSSNPESLELLKSQPSKKELLEYIKEWESQLGSKQPALISSP